MREARVREVGSVLRAQRRGAVEERECLAGVTRREERHAKLVKRVGLVGHEVECTAQLASRESAVLRLPRDKSDPEMRLPEGIVVRRDPLEIRARRREGGRVGRERVPTRSLEHLFEIGTVESEQEPAGLCQDGRVVGAVADRDEPAPGLVGAARSDENARQLQPR